MTLRIALTAGGTGGHIFPALAVLEALQQGGGIDEVRFFGPEDRGERARVEAHGLRFETVPAAAVRGRRPLSLAKSIIRLSAGTLTAVRKLRAFKPDVVFSTGGYASFPGSVAARLLRKPLVVYLPDVTPGWAVSAEQRLATRVATTTEAALAYLPRKKTVVTGYPVRPIFFDTSRDEARAKLNVPPGDRVVVVAGASQGAQALNRAVFEHIAALAKTAVVFHVTGERDAARAQQLRADLGSLADRYRPAPFRDDLPLVMLAADLAVMRAGASVLGELPAAALPSILIPGTFAGGHQRENAGWLADNGAAVVLEEADISELPARIEALLEDNSRLQSMRDAAKALARPDAAMSIANLVREVAKR
ncbi:MAG: UDP-N-acetylglucosamine--N-acetylmuramyl-(pentapeptide) pyrophosphoryl-undecaprenol N-acetylglucosamine transferase [Dehalococcoidia bacterium]|nr:UDP-N-acetylglucosamine--N-acetylmuramyl-(pentapeptide) pyrophosphoryl-undecaprenol N-acetylglucosamine transferase [Dehalococcoidia bacterium]